MNSPKRWLQTASGKVFYPGEPTVDMICIEDIAHALSNVCRYGGHCKEFYSVAQHSVLVSWTCDPADALWGLLHDASEAYIGDVVRSLKYLPEMQGYRDIEGRLMKVVCAKFGLPEEMPLSVQVADERVLASEKRDIMGDEPMSWNLAHEPASYPVLPWGPKEARGVFLHEFRRLTEVR